MNKVTYHWVIERNDPNTGNLLSTYYDKLWDMPENSPGQLLLCRAESNQDLVSRHYAKVLSDTLPDMWHDSSSDTFIIIPDRFHYELQKYMEVQNQNAMDDRIRFHEDRETYSDGYDSLREDFRPIL